MSTYLVRHGRHGRDGVERQGQNCAHRDRLMRQPLISISTLLFKSLT